MKIIVDCSPPPSTNRLWRYGKGHVYRSPEYERWRTEFNYHFRNGSVTYGFQGKPLKIFGAFDVEILVSSKRRDVDNNAKALLDICEDLGIIENDKFARRVVQERVEKDKAPLGCRLIIISLEENKNAERKTTVQNPKTKKANSRRKEIGAPKAAFAGGSNKRGKKESKFG